MGDLEGAPLGGKFSRLLELGRGGMARVWLAVSSGPTGFRKLLVIKQLLPALAADEHFRSMFLEEARLAARLNHPNVVQTLEIGEHSDAYFLVMEYLDGQSLHSVLERRKLPLALTVRVLIDTCEGLHHAHELTDLAGKPLNVVHRDVSPQNLFLTYAGQVKVLDFGLAKAADSSPAHKTEGLQGKLAYMAPERARSTAVDRRADVFSVGVLLWEAMTGRRFWEGVTDAQLLTQLRAGDLPPLPFASDPSLAEIVQRATHPKPGERYESAAALQSDLEDYLETSGAESSNRDLSSFVCGAFETDRVRRRQVIQEKMAELDRERPTLRPTLAAGDSSMTSICDVATPPPPGPIADLLRRSRNPDSLAPAPRSAIVAAGHSAPPSSTGEAHAENLGPPSAAPSSAPESSSNKPRLAVPDPYRLTRRLFSSAHLFEAVHRTTSRKILLQFFRGKCDAADLQQRFAKASQLSHPNTVQIIDAGAVPAPPGVGFVAREYVRGETLSALMSLDPLPPRLALRIATQVLMSLAEAHHRGLVHGRLEPDHVLVTRAAGWEPEVKVLGYWQPCNPRKAPDRSCRAPELATRPRPKVGADLYAVGAMLYRSLFGTYPAQESLEPPADSPSAALWKLPELRAALTKALAADPLSRFQSAQDMLHSLSCWSWPSERETAGAADAYLLGAMAPPSTLTLEPSRNQLMSTRPISIWVLDDGDVLGSEAIELALSVLGSQHEVRILGPAERTLAAEELRSGARLPPWVVLFGPLSVISREPLLPLLGCSAEVTRALVSDQDDVNLLRRCIRQTGLDLHIRLPSKPEALIEGVSRLVKRTRRVSQYYDSIRQQLHQGRDRVNSTSRELASNQSASVREPLL